MQIRAATKADIREISQIITSLVTEFILPTCTEQGAKLLLNSMDQHSIEGYFEAGYRYNVALIDNKIVAVIGIRENSHLYHLFVINQYQGQGIANSLWKYAKSEAIAQGNPGFFTVNAALNAEQLYLKWGFTAIDGVRERMGIRDIPMRLGL